MTPTKNVILALLLTYIPLCALITESDSIVSTLSSSLQTSQAASTLVFFDLDNTVGYCKATTYNPYTWAKLLTCSSQHSVFDRMHHMLALEPIEPTLPQTIKDMQAQGIIVVGLTARPHFILDATLNQLQKIDIQFSNTHPAPCNFANPAVQYENGVIFCGNTNKGDALVQFLQHYNLTPDQIIFFDDMKKNIEEVDAALKNVNMDGLCVHYTGRSSILSTLGNWITYKLRKDRNPNNDPIIAI